MKNPNLCNVCLLPNAIAELSVQVVLEGKITLTSRYGLMASVVDNYSLTEEETHTVNRLLYAVRRGRLKVVDEL